MQHVDALSRHSVMLVTSDELTYKIVNAQESDEYIRTIKKLLQEGKTSEFIVSNKILYKISEDQELLVVPEMMQVDVIKKKLTHLDFLQRQKLRELCVSSGDTACVDGRELWEISTWTFNRERRQGSDRELTKERGFSEWTLDEEVEDPGLKESNENGGRVGTRNPLFT
ncbi:transposon Tf2-9 polyprotein [Trichonephila clavipes]|nr:transposon Tf2-9 polyprotein [Trichonephila clavipes]